MPKLLLTLLLFVFCTGSSQLASAESAPENEASCDEVTSIFTKSKTTRETSISSETKEHSRERSASVKGSPVTGPDCNGDGFIDRFDDDFGKGGK